MKSGLIGCLSVVLALAALACAQAAAGELPSQRAASTAAGPTTTQTDGGGLTAEQALALAAVEPAGEEAYGSTSETTEMVVAIVVCVAIVIGVAVVVSHVSVL